MASNVTKPIFALLLVFTLFGCSSTAQQVATVQPVQPTSVSETVSETKHEISYSDFAGVMITVKSTAISEIGYLPEEHVLGLRFKESGVFYAYADVPESVYQEFISADSIGRYFNSEIKPNYDYFMKVKKE